MSRRNIAFAILLLAAAAGSIFSRSGSPDERYVENGIHRPLFWDEVSFYDAVLRSPRAPKAAVSAHGGIIPHHLLASNIIADFFQAISGQAVRRVILIGPNHYEVGTAPVITSRYDWDTPVGIVRHDAAFIDGMLSRVGFLSVEEDVAEREHSMSGIMPFLAHYVPGATVVPLMISANLDPSALRNLADVLSALGDDQTLFVASVDFSHYLPGEESAKRDQTTLALLRDRNLDDFMMLGNQYADSPKSVALLFMVMELAGASEFRVLRHEHSGAITGDPLREVTSYFSLVFEEP